MTTASSFLKRTGFLAVAIAVAISWLLVDLLAFMPRAHAAQLTSRKLTLSSSANGSITAGTAGTGTNGSKAKHTFDFTASGASIGSMEFLYCTTPLPGTTCTAPTGLDASTVTSIGGTSATGWSLGTAGNAPTANRLRITRTAATFTTVNLAFGMGGSGTDYIKNPTTDNQAFFVRITTFSDTAYTTTVDSGSVANSTAQQIDITAKVQETLNFSVGSPVSPATPPAPGATCAPLTDSGTMALGDADGVLSFSSAFDNHSYFRVSTNAINGTLVYYSGDTLKSGANTIASVGLTAGAGGGTSSTPGTAQFGLALDSSDTVSGSGHSFTDLAANNGSNIAGHGFNYANGNGTISAGGTAKFQFDVNSLTTPRPIAIASSTITCDTGSVRYLGNIATTTPPGIYTTTVTYLVVPQY